MKRQIILFLSILCLSIFHGCSLNRENTSEEADVYKERVDLFKQEGLAYQRQDIGLCDDYFFYYIMAESDEKALAKFYAQNITSDENPTELFTLCDDVIICASDVYLVDGKCVISLLYADEKDNVVKSDYSIKGEVLTNILIYGDWRKWTDIAGMAVTQDGIAYILTNDTIYIVDDNGRTNEIQKCPGNKFIKIIRYDNNSVCATYKNGEDVFALIPSLANGTNWNANRIFGNGDLITYDEELGLLFFDGSGISVLSENKCSNLISFDGRNIRSDKIRLLECKDGCVLLWGNSSDGTSAKLITFTPIGAEQAADLVDIPKERRDQFGRRIVYLYSFVNPIDERLDAIIDSFNERESDCQIVVMDNDSVESVYDNNLSKMIADGIVPDLLYSYYSPTLYKFAREDLLVDLYPCIDNSNELLRSDMDENVLEAYTVNNQLIGLPAYIIFDSLWTVDWFESNYQQGWSYKDFFEWFASADRPGGAITSKELLIKKLLAPILSECITKDGDADFSNEYFKSLLTEIAKLNINTKALDKNESMALINEWMRESRMNWLGTSILSYDSIFNSGMARGKEIRLLGYPSFDGSFIVYYDMPSLSIVSASDTKNDAFNFLQYYLKYTESENNLSSPLHSYIYTITENRNESIRLALESVKDDSRGTELMKKSIEETEILINSAQQKDYRTEAIMNIVVEEAMSFFYGKKDLDETCKVISSRVQILIDEAK